MRLNFLSSLQKPITKRSTKQLHKRRIYKTIFKEHTHKISSVFKKPQNYNTKKKKKKNQYNDNTNKPTNKTKLAQWVKEEALHKFSAILFVQNSFLSAESDQPSIHPSRCIIFREEDFWSRSYLYVSVCDLYSGVWMKTAKMSV